MNLSIIKSNTPIIAGWLILIVISISLLPSKLKQFESSSGQRNSSDYKNSFSTNTSSSSQSPSYRTGYVFDKDGIRFRSGPGVNYSKVGFLPQGTRLKVLDTNGPEDFQNNESGRWYKIQYNGQEGWVFGPFVRLE